MNDIIEDKAEQECDCSDDNIVNVDKQQITMSDYVPKKRKGFFYFWYLVIKRIFSIFLSSLFCKYNYNSTSDNSCVNCSVKGFGNPFYKQKRVGKKGKTLKIWKFRSMKKGADNLQKMLTPEQYEEYLKEYKLDDDPRLIGYKKSGDGKDGKCFGAK